MGIILIDCFSRPSWQFGWRRVIRRVLIGSTNRFEKLFQLIVSVGQHPGDGPSRNFSCDLFGMDGNGSHDECIFTTNNMTMGNGCCGQNHIIPVE